MKNIIILGATGSIGTNTLDIVARFPNEFRVIGLTAGSNDEKLEEQIRLALPGARVARMPEPEIGWLHVDVCDRGARSEWFGGLPRFPAFQWHYDAFDLPPMATRILTNDFAPNQGFVIDDRHVGFQCHIEMTRDLVETWCRMGADELPARSSAHRQSAADLQSDLADRLHALGEVADGVYARWAQKLQR